MWNIKCRTCIVIVIVFSSFGVFSRRSDLRSQFPAPYTLTPDYNLEINMTDKMRWRYGDTNPVVAAVDDATVIEIGDLVWQETDDAKPASAQTDKGSEAANQEALADAFLGVAIQRSRSGDTAPIRVATTGVFEFDCPSGTFELGDLMGADENAAGDALLNQQLAKVDDASRAIRAHCQARGDRGHQRVGGYSFDRHDRRRRRQPQR